MISNERRSPYLSPAYGASKYSQPRPPEDTIHSVEIQIERKVFVLVLKENLRGRFLRIIEDGGSSRRPVSIIVPATGLKDFQKILAEMVQADAETPPKSGTVGQ